MNERATSGGAVTRRDEARHRFLADSAWRAATVDALSGDASFRRYFRLDGGPSPALLMDAPPPQEDVRPFVKVAEHLSALGFSAPTIFAKDEAQGFLLIEDFGDDTYTRRLAAGGSETDLYTLAIDTLIALHRHPQATALALPPYDAGALLTEANLLVEWFLPAAFGTPTAPAVARDYAALWQSLFPLAGTGATTLVLRDYHVDNLMCLDGRAGIAACGLLDFQDALIGAPAYDLVSLLADARRDVAPDVRDAMMERYCAAFPDLDREAFGAAAAMLSAQRNCKIIGIFTRLMVRDAKPVYLQHIPRVWRLLAQDLTHPALAPLRQWIDETVPEPYRTIPDFDGVP